MGERELDVESIPFGLQIENVEKVENKNLIIKWNQNSKQSDSILPIEFLISNCPSKSDVMSEIVDSGKKFKFTKVTLTSIFLQI